MGTDHTGLQETGRPPPDGIPPGETPWVDPRRGVRKWSSHPWMRRFGAAAFLFFLIKGLAWLIVPAVIAWSAVR